jgi:uncharacterized membrane protein YraQ (UPF0718 family)
MLSYIDNINSFLHAILAVVTPFIAACWEMLVEMSPYMFLGFLMAGLLHVFVNPRIITKLLGKGRIKSVLYATLIGIPLPLCSCGVLPATAGLKKQGATDGAAMSFMIATPETGVDSMAVTYALLDPIMTIFRPVAAFFTAVAAGLTQNFFGKTDDSSNEQIEPDLSCRIDNCCDGINCPPGVHWHHHSLFEKLRASFKYGFGEILDDISKWLILGIAIAGAISVLVPESFMKAYLGGGISSMLIMLVVGIPFYTCATSSTPIAAALILKGVSPGAALVFLLAGPATNAATISVVYGLFRRRATVIYLACIAISAVIMGLLLDQVYAWFTITASSVAGEAGELIPHELGHIFALFLAILILHSLFSQWRRKRRGEATCCGQDHGGLVSGCDHDHAHTGAAEQHGGACNHGHSLILPSIEKLTPDAKATSSCTQLLPIDNGCCNHEPIHSDVEQAHVHSGFVAGCGHGHHACDHDHNSGHRQTDQGLPALEDSETLPASAIETIAKLKDENSRLRSMLVQRDLEIPAIRNDLPHKRTS